MKKTNIMNDALAAFGPRNRAIPQEPKAAKEDAMYNPNPGKAVASPPSLLHVEEGIGASPAEAAAQTIGGADNALCGKIIPLEVAPELKASIKMVAFKRGESMSHIVEASLITICSNLEGQTPDGVKKYLDSLYPISRLQGKRTSLMLPKHLFHDIKRIAVRTGIPVKNFINAAYAMAAKSD